MTRMSSAFRTAAFAVAGITSAWPVLAASSAKTQSIIQDNYPPESLTRGEQGVVHFSVDLDDRAEIDSCVVTKSSGYKTLDAATCDVIVKHAQFAPAESAGKRVATTRTGQMVWRLPEKFAANARRASKPVPQAPDELEEQRLLCQKSAQVGSVIKTVRFCLTRAEWAEGRQLTQESLDPATGGLHGCHLGAGTRCND